MGLLAKHEQQNSHTYYYMIHSNDRTKLILSAYEPAALYDSTTQFIHLSFSLGHFERRILS